MPTQPWFSSPGNHRGFTLVEMLVAITVIAILAAAAFPALSLVRAQAKEVKCRNNLQQIGTGIAAFRGEHQNQFPETLGTMFADGQVLAGEAPSLMICPFDEKKGQDSTMGRPAAWGTLTQIYEPGCSYIFEASGRPLGNPEQDWTIGTKTWSQVGQTWGTVKAYQLIHGRPGGEAFTPGEFPILRCFWHYAWSQAQGGPKSELKKVLNLSWDYRVFLSIPYWEHQADPNIPF